MEALLIAARFSHFAAALILFGLALFPVYAKAAWTPPLKTAALAAVVSSVAWLGLTIAAMGGSYAAAADPSTIAMVLRSMAFGQVWSVRLLLGLAIAMAAFAPASRPRSWMILVLSGLYLASIALTGHTQIQDGAWRTVHVVADATHLVAAGAWLGGLIGLAAVLPRRDPEVGFLLKRFSRMGYWAVGAIVASGLVNGFFLVGRVEKLFTTDYGALLLVKLILVGGMASLALANRFWISPRLYAPATAEAGAVWITRLRRNVFAEQALGGLVLAAVAVLGTLPPAAGG